jgi:ATP-dependent protease ClpP protease subunit
MQVRQVDRWFDFNLDETNRHIYLGSTTTNLEGYESGIDYQSSENFIKCIHILSNLNKKPIIVTMNNPGGDWYHGMAIFDAIKSSGCKVTVRVFGQAMSMGSVILQAAHSREIMPSARIMIHYGTGGYIGHPKDVERWAQEGQELNILMENIYVDRMLESEVLGTADLDEALPRVLSKIRGARVKNFKLPKGTARRFAVLSAVKEILGYDFFISPQEAVALGLVDKIYK